MAAEAIVEGIVRMEAREEVLEEVQDLQRGICRREVVGGVLTRHVNLRESANVNASVKGRGITIHRETERGKGTGREREIHIFPEDRGIVEIVGIGSPLGMGLAGIIL